MEIRITTLSENTANYGFLGEWGLSILVEADGKRILMDTGLSFSAVHNAQKIGIDLDGIDNIVLSHGHVDHTGGLSEIVKMAGTIEIIAHPDIWTDKYARRNHEKEQFVGMPCTREELESLGARFNLSTTPVGISDTIMTSGEIPMITGYEQIESNLMIKKGGALIPDPLNDDLALFLNTEFGIVAILGCAHRGIVNTLRHAQKLTGQETVYAVIGGTHLFPASEERIEQTIVALKDMGIQKMAVSHCTGFRASVRLSQEFGNIFFLNNAGTSFTLP